MALGKLTVWGSPARNLERWNLLVVGVLLATLTVVIFGAAKFPASQWRYGWAFGTVSEVYWFHGYALYPYNAWLYKSLVIWSTAGVPPNVAACLMLARLSGGKLRRGRLVLQRYKSSSGGTWLTDEAFQEPYF